VPTLQGLQHASLPLLPQASEILLLKGCIFSSTVFSHEIYTFFSGIC
jgi:hypothetical protein